MKELILIILSIIILCSCNHDCDSDVLWDRYVYYAEYANTYHKQINELKNINTDTMTTQQKEAWQKKYDSTYFLYDKFSRICSYYNMRLTGNKCKD